MSFLISTNPIDNLTRASAYARNIDKTTSFFISMKCKDEPTAIHAGEVATLALHITKYIKTHTNYTLHHTSQDAYIAGITHDIGKLKMADEILKGKYLIKDPKNNNDIRNHPLNGWKILCEASYPENIKLAVLQHHERYDGSGYPSGLEKTQITELGSLLAVVDTYSSMITDRPYRPAKTPEEALRIMNNEKHLYHPQLLEIMNQFILKTVKPPSFS